MPESNSPQSERSSFHFQMWDQYLKVLNRIWDLEGVRTPPESGNIGESLSELHHSWQVEPKPILSPPSSWLGYLLFPLKKLVYRWIHAYLTPVFSDQREFNARTVRTLGKITDHLDILVQKIELQKEVNAKFVQSFNALIDYIDRDILRYLEKEVMGLKKMLDERTELFRQLLDERSLKTQQILDERIAYISQVLNERTAYIQQIIFEKISFGKETLSELRQKLESCLQGYYIQNRKFERILSILNPDNSALYPHPVDRNSLSAEFKEELSRYRREIDAHKYLQFENQFRGDPLEIKKRQADYLPFFQHCEQVLDIGCGRGEFLELMRENHIGGYGIDTNGEMVAYCTGKGLKAEVADALTHLNSLADNSLDGIFSSQVIEHLDPDSLIQLIKLCYAKLKPDSYVVLETVNVSSILPFLFFFVDLSHKTPLHPQTAEFLMKAHGFTDVQIRYTSPVPDGVKLLTFTETLKNTDLQSYVQVMNENLEKLNTLLFGYRDYAIIARKLP
ncbi:MAG TPA: class I SAM-dependent methyltransferase [Candidatus Limnocylindrales bacterium]|nr:class I SAM-dependent methyltransferase [Candidatus Limnocylindrales bacterium]